jgi:hypothetical protein
VREGKKENFILEMDSYSQTLNCTYVHTTYICGSSLVVCPRTECSPDNKYREALAVGSAHKNMYSVIWWWWVKAECETRELVL